MNIHDEIRRHDGDGLETYLKQFQPVQAAPLPQRDAVRHTRQLYIPGFMTASFAILLIVGAFLLDHRAAPMWDPAETEILNPQPPLGLTISDANLLLKQSSSVHEALNSIAREPKRSFPQGKSSAFAALGKENFRL